MGRIQCRKLHAKISRCDKYSRPSWIRHQDIDNDARWSQPAHLEWPIDLAAFNKDFETLTRILAALNVQPFPPKPDQVMRRSLFMVDGIQLPPLPPAVSTMNHPFILGWAYTTEWWECFVEASWEQTGDDPPSRFFRSTTDTGFGDLKARLGPLRTAAFVSMAVRADLPLRDDVVFDMFFDQLSIADVIGIVCTDSQRHYCSRGSNPAAASTPAVSTYDHPFILGWPYSDEWWECFVAASYEQAERDRPSGPFTGSIMNIGLEHLKWRLCPGLQRIVFTIIAVRADLPIRDDIIFETVYDQLPITGIIGIACTASLSH
ncbi:hypothetical protein NUW54_g3934 [Trametes sanguinea]|uniref:Uncharacterized protein n=1 Tax=Trametes sanguinea TaxID=158606 RepID=A0ACC1Q1H6_9APHY|nr:hypothetical protein NUW54_g3934 [Trametes sanguinea]